MPKRGGRGGSRGGGHGNKSRGKNGGSFSGGRGKRGGRGGANRRGRGRGRGGYGGGGGYEDPDFIDLATGSPSIYIPQNSMKAAAKNTRRSRLQDEAFQTEDNRESTMKMPLRKRPVEFVMATTYDPSKDLVKRLRDNELSKKEHEQRGSSEQAAIIEEIECVSKEEDEDDDDDVMENQTTTFTEIDEKVVIPIEQPPSPIRKAKVNPLESVPDDELFFIDDEGAPAKNVKTVKVQPIAPVKKSGPNTEFDPVLSIGHVHLPTSTSANGKIEAFLPKHGKKVNNLQSFNPDQSIYEMDELNDLEDQLLDERNAGNGELYKSYQNYITRVMGNLFEDEEDSDDEIENGDEDAGEGIYDELDEDFEEEARFIAGIDEDGDEQEDGEEDVEDIASSEHNTATNFQKLNIDEAKEPADEEPEYGYLPEDYETFDHSLVDVINIRYGSTSNQYFMKSFHLTGTYDFQWVDQDLFEEFLTENGMPEDRIGAYFKYVHEQLTPPEEEEKNYDDIPISDSSEEEEETHIRDDYEDSEDDELGDSDMEGLDDLIQYTQRYDGLRDMDIESTKSLRTRGKGKKKELDLDHIADTDLRQSLMDQWSTMRKTKKDKKQRREEHVAKEHATSKDLLLKYPYTLHVKDIRDEFESFLHDTNRQSLVFPPMDPHGIKTIQKFAYLFNMKSRKFGKDKTSHAVVIKNKRTFRSVPDYHSANMLLKQRPIFNRIDQKRPRTEIEQEESKSSRRGKPSKAHVKEGDIVGADAPEIATDNVGRRLLLKMGWKSGQGLGLDNRGIPEPVIAKIKKTKLGIR